MKKVALIVVSLINLVSLNSFSGNLSLVQEGVLAGESCNFLVINQREITTQDSQCRSSVPWKVLAGNQKKVLKSGLKHTCVIENKSHLECWGKDQHGQVSLLPEDLKKDLKGLTFFNQRFTDATCVRSESQSFCFGEMKEVFRMITQISQERALKEKIISIENLNCSGISGGPDQLSAIQCSFVETYY